MDITIQPGETATIRLSGAVAVRVDAEHRVIAVDYVSPTVADAPLTPEWLVEDLRRGTYGDFHQLRPATECFDRTCAGAGEHATAEERAMARDTLGTEQATPVRAGDEEAARAMTARAVRRYGAALGKLAET